MRRWLRGFSRFDPPPEGDHIAFGAWGERAAGRFLRREKFRILHRNFRAPGGGEVDLVCRDRREGTLAFVEVKTRRNEERGRPWDAVDTAKQQLVARGAMAWLRLLDYPEIRFRFDVVEVIAGPRGPECTLIRDAFHLPEFYVY